MPDDTQEISATDVGSISEVLPAPEPAPAGMKYSPSTKGFYTDELHDSIPDDAVEISIEDYKALFVGQAEGQAIVTGTDGKPTLSDQPAVEITWDQVRSARNALLSASDWTQLADAPLADAERASWRAYRETLRNIPQAFKTAPDVTWPATPGS